MFENNIHHIQRTLHILSSLSERSSGYHRVGVIDLGNPYSSKAKLVSSDRCQPCHTPRCYSGRREKQLLKVDRNYPRRCQSHKTQAKHAKARAVPESILVPNFHLLQAYQGLAGALQAHSSGPLGHQFGINYRQPRAPLLICSLDSHIPLFGCAIARFHETQRPLDPSTLVVPSIPVDLLAADCF